MEFNSTSTPIGRKRDMDTMPDWRACLVDPLSDDTFEGLVSDSITSLHNSTVPSVQPMMTPAVSITPGSRLIPLQTWEGFVEDIDEENGIFRARLADLEPDSSGEEEIAELYLEDVDQDDRELVKPGGVFRWIIGYRAEPYGKRERVSALVFRRLPAWTRQDLDIAAREARRLAHALRRE
jgi:hypothetical protein